MTIYESRNSESRTTASLICLLIFALFGSVARADTTTISLLNPAITPLSQGWKYFLDWPRPTDAWVRGNYIEVNNLFSPVNLMSFYRHIPLLVEDGYAVDFWLKVHETSVPHDLAGSPVGFNAGIVHPRRNPSHDQKPRPRLQSIYFDKDGIGWIGDAEHYPMNTTDDFHHYRVEVESSGTARVLVDGQLALHHDSFEISPFIAFGVTSPNYDIYGSFYISRISVTGLLTEPVLVDVSPGQPCPNPAINYLETKKKVVVAILGTKEFDPTRIDPTTVRVNGVAPLGWNIRDAARPAGTPTLGNDFSVPCKTGTDGRKDLVLAFESRAVAAASFDVVNPTRPALLRVTGKTKPEFGLHAFAGEDVAVVRNVPLQ